MRDWRAVRATRDAQARLRHQQMREVKADVKRRGNELLRDDLTGAVFSPTWEIHNPTRHGAPGAGDTMDFDPTKPFGLPD